MTDSFDQYPALVNLLKERGHSDDEIARVLEKVRQYDQEMQVDSVMDSIAAGRMDLMAIIEEALNEG